MKISNRFMLLTGVVGMLLTAAPLAVADGGRGQIWQKADANQDGAIDRAEFEAMRQGHFARFDADGNGVVTAAEITAFVEQRHAARADATSDAARAEKMKNRGERMLQRLDADGDGGISATEWLASTGKRFARLDTNSDGRIEPAELPKRHKKGAATPEAAPAQP